MIDDRSPEAGQTFRFISGAPGYGAIAFGTFFVVCAIVTISTENLATVATPGNAAGTVVVLIFFASILFAGFTRVSIVEIDTSKRRLSVQRQYFGRWTRTIVDCPLDESTAFGTIQYDTEGHKSYGTYVELKSGRRHAIPINGSSFADAARVASSLSAATGIPRSDTIF